MSFYASAAAAEGAGYRPCLRCRPERAPGLSSVDASSRLAGAALAGIEEHAVSNASLTDLAVSLGVSDRHLRRVTEAELGVSPIQLAQTRRLLLAKQLIGDTALSLTEIAFASGFGSVRRFNASFKSSYGMSPRELRPLAVRARVPRRPVDPQRGLTCRVDFRPPLAWEKLLEYLRLRAIPGVESVDATHYRRTVALRDGRGTRDCRGWVAVSLAPGGLSLEVELAPSLAPVIGAVLLRIKQLFDLRASPHAIVEVLGADPALAGIVERIPGLRVPGAFDGFELGVRAILGQQISVRAATTVAGRWAAHFGESVATPFTELTRLSPTVTRVAEASVDEIAALGIVGSRARSIGALAGAVLDQRVTLTRLGDVEAQIEALMRLPGIGAWTAQYIAMRALHWPDAFPGTDLMLLRAANATPKQLLARAEAWRPWRAYATHYLWNSLGVSA